MSPFFRHIEKPYTQTNSPTKSVPPAKPQIPDPTVKQHFK